MACLIDIGAIATRYLDDMTLGHTLGPQRLDNVADVGFPTDS